MVEDRIVPRGFEPLSQAPKACMLDHYTTGLTWTWTYLTFTLIVTFSVSIIFKCMVGIKMMHLASYLLSGAGKL